MRISVAASEPQNLSCDAVAIGFFEGTRVIDVASLDRATGGLISTSMRTGEFAGKDGQLLLLQTPALRAKRVILIGLGKREDLSLESVINAAARAANYLMERNLKKIAIDVHSLHASLDLETVARACVEGALLGMYRFTTYKTEKDEKRLEEIVFLLRNGAKLAAAKKAAAMGQILAEATNWARDLGNTPAGIATPAWVVEQTKIMKRYGIRSKVIEEKEAKRLGMGAFLAVAQGSTNPPKFLIVEWRGSSGAPLVLVGKSITFDSGGINLKTADSIWRMWHDKCGGTTVLGAIMAAARLKAKTNVIGILPLAENMPSGSAYKPGDILRASDGKTIEVIDTDAEGRLTLADGIAYAKKLRPSAIIDLATLTGAVRSALGPIAAGLYTNDSALQKKIENAAHEVGERVWAFPLWKEYAKAVESSVADLRNIGVWNRVGGLPTSASFLEKFAAGARWAHLDIASVAWLEGEKLDKPYLPKEGATGWGVRLLSQLIMKWK